MESEVGDFRGFPQISLYVFLSFYVTFGKSHSGVFVGGTEWGEPRSTEVQGRVHTESFFVPVRFMVISKVENSGTAREQGGAPRAGLESGWRFRLGLVTTIRMKLAS